MLLLKSPSFFSGIKFNQKTGIPLGYYVGCGLCVRECVCMCVFHIQNYIEVSNLNILSGHFRSQERPDLKTFLTLKIFLIRKIYLTKKTFLTLKYFLTLKIFLTRKNLLTKKMYFTRK